VVPGVCWSTLHLIFLYPYIQVIPASVVFFFMSLNNLSIYMVLISIYRALVSYRVKTAVAYLRSRDEISSVVGGWFLHIQVRLK